MIYEYSDNGFRYTFEFRDEFPGYIDIITRWGVNIGGSCSLHKIKDGKIIWRQDDFMHLTEGAKEYISRIVKMKAFL